MNENTKSLNDLRELMIALLNQAKIKFKINGSLEKRIPGNLNITVDGIDAFELISCLPEIAISTGSACSSHAIKIVPSHVLKSITLSDVEIKSSFRVGIGRFNKIEDIKLATHVLIRTIKNLLVK